MRSSRPLVPSPGQPYEPLALTEALSNYVEKLHKSGRYEAAASYRSRPSEDATTVDLTIFVQIGRAVTIAYRGDPIPREKLADLVPLAREGSVEEDRVEDSVQRIRALPEPARLLESGCERDA